MLRWLLICYRHCCPSWFCFWLAVVDDAVVVLAAVAVDVVAVIVVVAVLVVIV